MLVSFCLLKSKKDKGFLMSFFKLLETNSPFLSENTEGVIFVTLFELESIFDKAISLFLSLIIGVFVDELALFNSFLIVSKLFVALFLFNSIVLLLFTFYVNKFGGWFTQAYFCTPNKKKEFFLKKKSLMKKIKVAN